jgi:putative aldouronate transport system substrate-binding protein
MINKSKKLLALCVSIFIVGTNLAGCAKGAQSSDSKSNSTETEKSAAQTVTYPISGNNSLKVWMPLNTNVSAGAKSFADTPLAKELEKKTGVKIEYTHPPMGADNEKTAFNLLVASGDLPDIIEWNWINDYQGGPEKAIADKVILKLNDVIEKNSPNLKKYLEANPEVNKMCKSDNGSYFMYPFVRGDVSLMVFQGPIIRQDLLNELNLPMPTTIDEWYTTLKAFKDKKNLPAPMALQGFKDARGAFNSGGFLSGAYGVKRSFYLDNGKVKFGPYEQGYKDFLTTMRKWYAEGLIDKNFASTDSKAMDALMSGGQAGASFGFTGSSLGTWQSAAGAKDPKIVFAGAPYPTINKGEKPKFGQRDVSVAATSTLAITTSSKKVELAAKWLDYGYSKEGELLYNFGIEGESYKMNNSYPTYTDVVLKNPNKLSIGQAIAQYARSSYQGPFVQRKEYIEQYLALQSQKDAVKTWSNTDADKVNMPPVTPTSDESAQYAKIMNDVNTYVDEMSIKFILGTEPLDNFSKYIDQLKKMDVEKAISIQQAALERFNKR